MARQLRCGILHCGHRYFLRRHAKNSSAPARHFACSRNMPPPSTKAQNLPQGRYSCLLWTHGESDPALVHAMDALYHLTMGPFSTSHLSYQVFVCMKTMYRMPSAGIEPASAPSEGAILSIERRELEGSAYHASLFGLKQSAQ